MRTLPKLMMPVACALLLGACASPSEQSAAMQREMDRMMLVYGPACQKLGFTAQSDQWRSCVLQLSTKEEISNASFNASYAYYHPYSPRYRRWP
jgi:hypothetical protein